MGYAFLFLCTVYIILSGTRFAGHLGSGVVGFVLLTVFLAFFYDKMGTEDQKPVAEEGHAVGSCEATMVIPVHKVLPFFVSAMLLCVFHYFFKIFLSQYVAEESFHVKLSTLLSVSQNLKVLDEYYHSLS